AFSAELREYLRPHSSAFGPDDARRLEKNPLRLFDSNDSAIQALLTGAPKTLEFLDDKARAHHDELKRLLPLAGVVFYEDPTLVRGLDYYTLTVFEVTSGALGAQDALLGGGRYDDLVAELGGPPISAVGFAIGEDRLLAAMQIDPRDKRPLIFVVPDSRYDFIYALGVSSEVRACFPDAVVETDFTGKGVVRGIARAAQILNDRSRYAFSSVRVVLLGLRERENDTVTVKDLSTERQETFPRRELAERFGAARER
ncbi:MAG TPA: ATP phosphoribosyltransferase regulatory subunit, partial [Thermoanaerobaculia bacterium]|nr:ATP phosphoribosyltransferase regulatory subunit [Thermoanaerobaculia bacterium]